MGHGSKNMPGVRPARLRSPPVFPLRHCSRLTRSMFLNHCPRDSLPPSRSIRHALNPWTVRCTPCYNDVQQPLFVSQPHFDEHVPWAGVRLKGKRSALPTVSTTL